MAALPGPPAGCNRPGAWPAGAARPQPTWSARNHPLVLRHKVLSEQFNPAVWLRSNKKHLTEMMLNQFGQLQQRGGFGCLFWLNSWSGLKFYLVWKKPRRGPMFLNFVRVASRFSCRSPDAERVLFPSARPLFTLKGPSCSLHMSTTSPRINTELLQEPQLDS